MSEDQRNSFSLADQRQLATLAEPLAVTVHLAPEDPRYMDLQRNVLAKLERVMPQVSIRLGAERRNFASPAGDDAYGEIEYRYGGRSDISRSTEPARDFAAALRPRRRARRRRRFRRRTIRDIRMSPTASSRSFGFWSGCRS